MCASECPAVNDENSQPALQANTAARHTLVRARAGEYEPSSESVSPHGYRHGWLPAWSHKDLIQMAANHEHVGWYRTTVCGAPCSRPRYATCNAAVTDAIQITFARHRSNGRLGADSRGPPTIPSGGQKQQDPMRPASSAIFRCCAGSIEVADGSPGGGAYGVPRAISAAALSFRVPRPQAVRGISKQLGAWLASGSTSAYKRRAGLGSCILARLYLKLEGR